MSRPDRIYGPVQCHPSFMPIRRSYPNTKYFKASNAPNPATGGVTHGSRNLRNPAAAAHPLHARPQWPVPACLFPLTVVYPSPRWRRPLAAAWPPHHSGSRRRAPSPHPWCTRSGVDGVREGPSMAPPPSYSHRRQIWRPSIDGLPLLEAEDGGRRTIVRCLHFACGSCWWCPAACTVAGSEPCGWRPA